MNNKEIRIKKNEIKRNMKNKTSTKENEEN